MAHPIPTTPTGVDATDWANAIGAIRDYCGWHIAPEVEEAVTLDGSGMDVQTLPTRRVAALTSITNDGVAVTDPEWSEAGMVRGDWTHKYRGVVVTMTHGYEEWPTELLNAATEIVAAVGRGGVSQVTSGSHQVSFDTAAKQQHNTLDRYRLSWGFA